MNIVSNCPLCEERGLHVMEEEAAQGVQQCLNCGYVTSDKYKGSKLDNEEYKTLSEEMQSWSKEANDRIWIPSMLTLPFGTLYPINKENYMYWAFAGMVDILEEEKEDYPDGNGGYFEKRYDTDNPQLFDTFLEAMSEMNERAKENTPTTIDNTKLPKLKKVSG